MNKGSEPFNEFLDHYAQLGVCMKYLAAPFSSKDEATMTARFEAVNKTAAKMMLDGDVVFSPLSHSVPIAKHMDGKMVDHEFWMSQDLPLLGKCDELVVLTLPGWVFSKGVITEMNYAIDNNIPITMMEYEGEL